MSEEEVSAPTEFVWYTDSQTLICERGLTLKDYYLYHIVLPPAFNDNYQYPCSPTLHVNKYIHFNLSIYLPNAHEIYRLFLLETIPPKK